MSNYNFVTETRDALRKKLVEAFPAIERIYVGQMPDGFKRPCFLVYSNNPKSTETTSNIVDYRAIWGVVYFAALDKDNRADQNELDEMEGNLLDLRLENILESPNGYIFNILDVDCNLKEKDLLGATVMLQGQKSRAEPTFDIAGSAEITVR